MLSNDKFYHDSPFFTSNDIHPNSQQIQTNVIKLNRDIELYGKSARLRTQDLLSNILKLRTAKNLNSNDQVDRLTMAWDSAGDLPSLYIIADEAKLMGVHVHIVHYRSVFNDDSAIAFEFLKPLKDKNIIIDFFDYLISTKDIRIEAIKLFAQGRPTVSITDLSDAMDLREDVCNAQKHSDITNPEYDSDLNLNLLSSGLEIPNIDLKALNSNMFNESRDLMVKYGNLIIIELKKYVSFKFIASDGMDLSVYPGKTSWINEAENFFSVRPIDYVLYPDELTIHPPVWDNPPGEVFGNSQTAHGTLILYQIDTDVIDFSIRHPELFSQPIQPEDRERLVYDPEDPIRIDFDQTGHALIESITSPGTRAKILQEYFKKVVSEDKEATAGGDIRPENAALLLAGIGFGINGRANNPEDLVNGIHIVSVLITEKMRGIWHLAIGKYAITESGFNNRSGSHIDNGLRNTDLRVYGIEASGEKILLTSAVSGEKGTVNVILDEMKQEEIRSNQSIEIMTE